MTEHELGNYPALRIKDKLPVFGAVSEVYSFFVVYTMQGYDRLLGVLYVYPYATGEAQQDEVLRTFKMKESY